MSDLFRCMQLQGWLLGALAAVNALFLGFLYSPEAATRPFKALFRPRSTLKQVSRKFSESSVSMTSDSTVSRNTSSGGDSLMESLSDAHLQQSWKDSLDHAKSGPPNGKQQSPPAKAKGGKKLLPAKASSAKGSPVTGGSEPSTPRNLQSEASELEADLLEQTRALKALAEQRDNLARDLKVSFRLMTGPA